MRPSGTASRVAIEADPGYAITEAGPDRSPAAFDSALTASNPAHGLRLLFEGSGTSVQPIDAEAGAWRLGIALDAIGRAGHAEPLEPIALTMEESRVTYSFSNRVLATFDNAERGLGIAVSISDSFARFAGPAPLRIELTLSGPLRTEASQDAASAELSDKDRAILRIDQLRASDATGRQLVTRIESGHVLALVVDDADAVYPISAELVLSAAGRPSGAGSAPGLARSDGAAPPSGPTFVIPNDTCAGAIVVDLDTPVFGDTTSALDDYRSPAGASCYSGIGQGTSTAAFFGLGRDAAYVFTAPDADTYSFRASAYGGSDLLVYLTETCPAVPPAQVVSCIAGANRTGFRDEEIFCRSLTAGQAVHVIVDDRAFSAGGPFRLEVNRCRGEVESNDAPGTATPATCGVEGAFSVGAPFADADFYSLGAWSAGSRLFALADANAAANFDLDMRVTSNTDTLEFDDSDADTPFGPTSATCDGTPLPGGPTFLRVNSRSTAIFEPYRLYAAVQPPAAQAVSESEPNNTLGTADASVADYFAGALASAADVDVFSFQATAGELLFIGLDADPLRDATPINAALALLDSAGSIVMAVNDLSASSTTTPGTGSLASFTPTSPGEGIVWRATYTGTYFVRVTGAAAGDWLLSIARDCVAASPTDLRVTKTAPPLIGTGASLVYDLRVRNAGANDASTVVLSDTVPSSTRFQSLSAPAGWSCTTPAVGGTGDISCNVPVLPAGVEAVFALTVRTDWCAGAGTNVLNTAEVTSATVELNSADNSASALTVLTDPGVCDDGNACTLADVCQVGVCVGTNPVVCTASNSCHAVGTCNPQTGICSDPVLPNGTSCNDGNACTQTDTCQSGACTGANPVVCTAQDQCHTAGTCDTGTGVCSNPAKPNGTACNDANLCTQTDTCQAGACQGANAVVCTQLDPCHQVGVCAPATGVCSNPQQPDGTACTDGNLCTQTDTCQSGSCSGANPVVCAPPDQCHLPGTCAPATGVCSNPAKPDGTACNDANLCTLTDTCQAGACQGSNPLSCSAIDDCHEVGVCAPATGVCSNPVRADGSACNDGNGCTQTDGCVSGACQGSNPVVCPAPDACHLQGTCAPATGVCSTPIQPNGTTCADGDACTQTDLCQEGSCIGTQPVVCTASDQCHLVGTCAPATGLCSNPPKANGTACTDGDACTQTDTCQAGACQGASPVVCTASDQCHAVGTCAPATGQCSNPELPDGTGCSDSDLCTQSDTCQAGACTGASPVSCATVCTPGVDCPSDYKFSHNPETEATRYLDEPHNIAANGNANDNTGFDQYYPGQLTDGLRGADDWSAGSSYAWVGWAFDDPSVTLRFPSARTLASVSVGLNRNEGVLIFEPDEIHIELGLDGTTFDLPIVFRQSDATLPTFADGTREDVVLAFPTQVARFVRVTFVTAGKWTFVDEIAFGAPDQCHEVGTCAPETGLCSNPVKPDDTPCDDGDLCTESDACQAGTCLATPVVCTAQDDCHEAGACDAGTGACSNPAKPDGESCSDGNLCTQTDTCATGVCQGANPVVCPAPVACHLQGVCVPGTGVCTDPLAANGTMCEDGAFCSVSETCTAGACGTGTPRVCTDPAPCTVGSCDEINDECDFSVVNGGDPDGDGVPACIDSCPNDINGGSNSGCVPAPAGLIAWWPLDETEGTGSEDLAGDHDGVRIGSPSPVAGRVAGALSFDGTDDHVEVPDDAGLDFGTGDFSVDAWIRTSSASIEPELLLDKRREQSLGGPQGWALFTFSGRLWFQISSGGAAQNFDSGVSVNDGAWHHVAVTVDRDNPSGGTFYIDFFAPLPLPVTFNPTSLAGTVDNDLPLRLGRRSDSSDPGFYAGELDEVELFRGVALSAADVEAIATAGAAGKCKPGQDDLDGDGDGDACDADDDGDGASDATDCAPLDDTAYAVPDEVALLRISPAGPGSNEIEWSTGTGGSAHTYSVVTGPLGALPVGSGGGASESGACGVSGTTTTVALDPAVGSGAWIIVRAQNQCGAGDWGSDRDNLAAPFPLQTLRETPTCP